ncbi:uncharacterized protein LOC133858642 [Alnus glutinosa]|uniref:uncharacterized protein LOC133858642 n=1 Tax=Alnus glutinosa TaxID=3517 RepID=UPI002D78B4B7|nr:uncharacterized protein LOC133858642 [Alnus glutinosa]
MVVTKLVRKLMLAMMELFILILLDVQANDLALTSLSMSSPPIIFPYSFEVDEAEGMYKCITNVVEGCESTKKTWPLSDLRYQNSYQDALKCHLHADSLSSIFLSGT